MTYAQHARIYGLRPDTDYVYKIVSDGDTQFSSAFRTAPEGRAAFRFTSVGDIACGDTAFSKASLNAIATAASIESFNPVVHLVNGDLSYANYERSYLVRGTDSGTVLRPHVVSTNRSSVDSDKGLVHLVIGTGGTHGHDDVYQTGTAGEPTETINVSGTRPRPRTRRGPRSPTPTPPTRGASACST